MNNNINKAKQLSFWQLIKDSKIEIPIIQRDYAQGREDKSKIRNIFLNDIKSSLLYSHIELDFVYGSNIGDSFQPLDGQQRLTTLYLLHWYIATKENKNDTQVKDLLKKFTYKTRTSSSEFCYELVDKGISINNKNDKITPLIEDASWFILSWKKDPTIKAMLTMLDAIHALFKVEENLWTKLTDEINRPVTFHYLELENFGLSDDLYIKMNARGKQLTSFEEFKADFIKHIESEQWEKNKTVTETFSHLADTKWTDLFWKHRKDNNKIDNSYLKFIVGIAINFYAKTNEIYEDKENEATIRKELEEKGKIKKITDEAVRIERVERRIIELFNDPNVLESKDFISFQGFDYLVKNLNLFSEESQNYEELFPENLTLWEFCNNSNLFKEFVREGETTYKQRVLFYAQTEYLLTNETFNSESFSNWMRVVRNIVQNSTIDSVSTFRGAITLINEINHGSKNIYSFLSKNSVKSKFAELQVLEEIEKSYIIKDFNRNVIFETEDTNFCKGRISFALYCVNYEKGKLNLDIKQLAKINAAFKKYLDKDDITNEFRRALLTINDNHFYDYWTSYTYVVNTPKKCLIEDINDLKKYSYNDNYKNYLKELILLLTEKELPKIIDEYIQNGINIDTIPNWKKRLLVEPNLLDSYCQSKYIAIPEDEAYCFLLRVGKPRDINSCKKII